MSQSGAVISLTTDFGLKDPFVGVMKGAILSRYADARIVDLTHDILAYWPAEAGFWLAKSFRYFPAGSVHVAIVDPGVGTDRDIIVSEAYDHLFLAPDNGLLQTVVATTDAKTYRLSSAWLEQQNWPLASSTFHGRDIFAPLAAMLAKQATRPEDIGPQVSTLTPSPVTPAYRQGDAVHGTIITVDHFGNLISDIEADQLVGFRAPVVQTGGKLFRFHRTYGDCKPGELLALTNSFGVVEISRNSGSAADTLGLGRGTPVVVRDAARSG